MMQNRRGSTVISPHLGETAWAVKIGEILGEVVCGVEQPVSTYPSNIIEKTFGYYLATHT